MTNRVLAVVSLALLVTLKRDHATKPREIVLVFLVTKGVPVWRLATQATMATIARKSAFV